MIMGYFVLAYIIIGAIWTLIGSIGMFSGKMRIEFTNCDEDGNDLGKMNILWNVIFWPYTLYAVVSILWDIFIKRS